MLSERFLSIENFSVPSDPKAQQECVCVPSEVGIRKKIFKKKYE